MVVGWLEVGSGGGRDARALESRGLSVRRTDISRGFVELLRADGYRADVLDPLTDDLGDPDRPSTPYDGVWACACLLHVARDDLETVLRRLAEVTQRGGPLYASFKEGDGEAWQGHGTLTAPRHFTFWRAPNLRHVVVEAGWIVDEIHTRGGGDTTWLTVRAHRA